MPRRPTKEPDIALRSPVVLENLPFPLVYYPNHYGTFFAFADGKGGSLVLCSCAKPAVSNYLLLRENNQSFSNSNPLRHAPLDSFVFPNDIARESLHQKEHPLSWLRFEPHLCHRCNIMMPTLRYCVEMYGGKFKQCYGWYISQAAFRLGAAPRGFMYLERVCPPELAKQIEEYREVFFYKDAEEKRLMELVKGPKRSDIADDEITYWRNVKICEAELYTTLTKKTKQLERFVSKRFENIAREEFGFRKVGEMWVSESLLHQIVCQIFPNDEVVRHLRPQWLDGLELDIFLPRRNIAFEYQGQQHFHPIAAWGGKKALNDVKYRDKCKAKICKQLQVTLVTVDYTEPLTESHIRDRLKGEYGLLLS